MEFRRHHLQRIAAAKAAFSKRTARRIETDRRPPPPQSADRRQRRHTPDPFAGLWDVEIRPMLEAQPGLRPITLLEEMQRRHPDHDWDRLRRSLERRVRAWRAKHGADREVIFRQDHLPGQQGLSDFTDMGDLGVSIAGQPLDHRLYHFALAYSAWEHAEPVLGGESFTALAVGLQNALWSLKTAVDAIFVGRERAYNRRFAQMCSHYLIDPVACTPASGWEKGQVENQVGLVRERFFTPRLRVKSYDELNAWLVEQCISYARAHHHPEVREHTIWEQFEAERPSLVPYAGRFDGFHAVPTSVSKTCLVRFDNNRYSVLAHAIGRPVEIRAYADRIELRQDGRPVGEHARCFGRDQTVFDPWHYVPVLARKPGALRNGAPFTDWVLPAGVERVRRKLAGSADGDRQMVGILTAVLSDGLPAVEAARQEALREGVHSADVVINILARKHEPAPPATIMTPDALRLRHAPVADCTRYDSLRRAVVSVAATTGRIGLDAAGEFGVCGYAVRAALVGSAGGVQFQGSSVCSSQALVRPETTRSSTSVSHTIGSTPFNFAVWISVIAIAQCRAPPSEPANKSFLRVKVCGRIERSTTFVCVPWQGALFSPVEIRAGKLSLQPEALGAGQEATNGLKLFEKRPL